MTRATAFLLATTFIAAPVLAASDPAGRCMAAKLKATAKKTTAKLKCHATAALDGRNPDADPGCLAKAEAKFSAAWARIEAKGGCSTDSDEQRIESKVDLLVTDVVTSLSCGELGGVCGGRCPNGLACFKIGVGCHGEPEPCRCHGSTTTCPPSTSTSTTSTTLP